MFSKGIWDSKYNNNGFTLIEILVSLALFSLVISITVGIFIVGSGSQRKIIELYTVQREASYIMETVSRELRMAIAICDNGEIECGAREDQQNNANHDIEFKNYNGDWIKYCLADINNNCGNGAGFEYFSRDGSRISSPDVKIENLIFYVSEDFNQTQPLITIVLKVKSRGKYGTNVVLQDSVSLRIYN
ncbi:MAG: prepilin-type N-terminal cleavage/methylation domain-containing protein [Candidatus Pacebacteria bacterium]|nr:prepilin-type N-terminal cleavage/methylation domain-containing protein [Candidatus Paceibacterota bacterium]